MTDGGPVREMTLDEWVDRLAKPHGARLELAALRAENAQLDSRVRSLEMLPAKLAEATAERDALRAEIADWKRDHAQVMHEECPSDEKHCTCVPHLRHALAAANVQIDGALRTGDRMRQRGDSIQRDLTAANVRIAKLEAAIRDARNELGIPQPGYPSPVANAVHILHTALAVLEETP